MPCFSAEVGPLSKANFVLDYDGVILNSLFEKFVVGFNAHLRIAGTTPLLGGSELHFDDYRGRLEAEPEIFEAFRAYVPLIGDVGENSVVFRLIERGLQVQDRESFRTTIADFGDDYLQACSAEVLELRRRYSEIDANTELCPAFPSVVHDIKQLANDVRFTICTTKPLQNVEHFNEVLGIGRFIGDIHVCEDNRQKVDILDRLAQDFSVENNEVGFIDDFARHLLPAHESGFKCFYAAWGFGGPEDEEAVERAGIPALGLDGFAPAIREFIVKQGTERKVSG